MTVTDMAPIADYVLDGTPHRHAPVTSRIAVVPVSVVVGTLDMNKPVVQIIELSP
jgi:hypothetical protein